MKMIKTAAVTAMLSMPLAGCLGNFTTSGLGSTAASVTASALGATIGGPFIGAAAGLAAGVATDAAIAPTNAYEAISSLPEEERASALKAQYLWSTIENLGYWVIVGLVAFFSLPMLVGYFLPNGRQRKLEKLAFDNPNMKSEDLK